MRGLRRWVVATHPGPQVLVVLVLVLQQDRDLERGRVVGGETDKEEKCNLWIA